MTSDNHVRVAIVGSGPAGMGAAIELAGNGLGPIVLIERQSRVGGIPAKYRHEDIRTFVQWTRARMISGKRFVDQMVEKIEDTDTRIWNECQVLTVDTEGKALTLVDPQRGKFNITADAVILACGAREKTIAERGWIGGSRAARVYFTHQLLDLLEQKEILPCKNPVIIGSDLIAYAAAAKLKNAGADSIMIIDNTASPRCSIFERVYFRRWVNPSWQGRVKVANITGNGTIDVTMTTGQSRAIECDGIFVCGELVPNSELVLLGDLDVDRKSRRPGVTSGHQLSAPGWYVAGNMLGGFHGAQWCYFDGVRTGQAVHKYLKNFR